MYLYNIMLVKEGIHFKEIQRRGNLPGLSPTEGHPLQLDISDHVMDEIPPTIIVTSPMTISQSSSLSSESRASSKLQRTEAVREEESLHTPPTTPDDSTELTTELDRNIDIATIAICRVEEMINFERQPPQHVPEWNMRTRVTILSNHRHLERRSATEHNWTA